MKNKKIYTTTFEVIVTKDGGCTGVEIKQDGDKLNGFGLEQLISRLMEGKKIDGIILSR